MRSVLNTVRALGVLVLAAGVVACGPDGVEPASATTSGSASSGSAAERPQIVVTTNILGDVVNEAVGDQADVEVIMPLGSDPHDFAPSAREAESMENADLLVVNGAGFEEGMLDIIANVSDSGTEVFSFADQIDLLEFTGDRDDGHDDESDDMDADETGEHADETHEAEDGDESRGDPHLWTDPTRIATAVDALESAVADLDGVETDALSASVDDYVDELRALDASMEEALTVVPDDRRVLVTNHEVFGYFADRFGFEVVGAIIPSLTTNAKPSAADIEELAGLIEAEGIQAIFGETTESSQLADVLADEVGGEVAVVELFSESLGEAGSGAATYIDLMRTNADLIAEALSS